MKRGVGDAVPRRIGASARHERRIALDAVDRGDLHRKRQAEVSEPAEEVERAIRGLRRQQLDCARHHELVERAVDLHEIGRRELDARGRARQLVAQRLRRRRGGATRLEAAALQVERDAVIRSKSRSRSRSAASGSSSTRSTSAVALSATATSICATRRLMLRPPTSPASAATSAPTGGCEHLATSRIREEGAAALAEADEDLAFLVHVLAARRAAAIAPHRPVSGGSQRSGRHAADALERLGHDAAFASSCAAWSRCCERAAAADAEMTAARRDAFGAAPQHLDDHSLVVAPLPAHACAS